MLASEQGAVADISSRRDVTKAHHMERVRELRPQYEAMANNVNADNNRYAVRGWAIGAALGASGVAVATAKAPAASRVAYAAMGAVLGAGVGGFASFYMETPSEKAMRSPEGAAIRNEYLARRLAAGYRDFNVGGYVASAGFHNHVLYGKDRMFQREWKLGEANTADGSIATQLLRDVAPFDHDGDGTIDLGSGSVELERDRDSGGAVSSDSRPIDTLANWYRDGDKNADGKLSPQEAVQAAVGHVRDLYWIRSGS